MAIKSKNRKNGKLKQEIIKRINMQFGLDIPLDYPIVTHQTKFADSGGNRWYLCGDNIDFNKFGGCYTLSETLKHNGDFETFTDDGGIEISPNKSYWIDI